MASSAPTALAEEKAEAGLSVAIRLKKDKSGTPTIDRDGKYQVVFTNHSKKPIRLWSEQCQLGHATLSFRVEDGDGMASLMHKRMAEPSGLSGYERPKTITILPGETLAWEVAPSDFFWGERMWKGVPEPNTGRRVTLTAVLSIKPTDAARKQGVWTGRLASQPIKALVVDATLRTPHEYLWADCPKQALKLMQADRAWITKTDDSQCTPLHHAARFGFVKVVRWLLANGADVNAKGFNQCTPLHVADDPAIVKELLRHKPDFTARDSAKCRTALEHATYLFDLYSRRGRHPKEAEKWERIVQMLRDAGAPYDIHSAIYSNDVAQVRRLLGSDKDLVRKTNGAQWLPLRLAASEGRTEICKLLLAHKADPVDLKKGNGYPVLKAAIQHPEIVKLLLEAGAPPDTRITWRGGRSGRRPVVGNDATPLHFAAEAGAVESAKLLIDKGAKVDARDDRGQTPLHIAALRKQPKMIRFLLDCGTDRNAKTKDGQTPLDLVVKKRGFEPIADMLRDPNKSRE